MKGAKNIQDKIESTEQILRQAKNKYYLKREHLNPHKPAGSGGSQGCNSNSQGSKRVGEDDSSPDGALGVRASPTHNSSSTSHYGSRKEHHQDKVEQFPIQRSLSQLPQQTPKMANLLPERSE